jgi:hypothetical protein
MASEDHTTHDLHGLTRVYGVDAVADALGRTVRSTVDVRSGQHALTVDDLYRLLQVYPRFDLEATVLRIGQVRKHKGRA